MSELNVPLDELTTTEGMDFSYRGTPLAPSLPEHYTNKQYIDGVLTDLEVRSPAAVTVTCDGIAETYTVTHNLNTTNIASIQVFDTTGGTKNPIGLSWAPTSVNAITLKPDVLLPDTMTLLVIVNA
jgi:hypothetical protein